MITLREIVVLAPHGQVSDLLPIGCLVVVGYQAYNCFVIGKLNDGIGVMPGCAVMSEQGVQDETEQAPMMGTRVQDGVTYLYHLGAARQEVQDPVAERCLVPGSLA